MQSYNNIRSIETLCPSHAILVSYLHQLTNWRGEESLGHETTVIGRHEITGRFGHETIARPLVRLLLLASPHPGSKELLHFVPPDVAGSGDTSWHLGSTGMENCNKDDCSYISQTSPPLHSIASLFLTNSSGLNKSNLSCHWLKKWRVSLSYWSISYGFDAQKGCADWCQNCFSRVFCLCRCSFFMTTWLTKYKETVWSDPIG